MAWSTAVSRDQSASSGRALFTRVATQYVPRWSSMTPGTAARRPRLPVHGHADGRFIAAGSSVWAPDGRCPRKLTKSSAIGDRGGGGLEILTPDVSSAVPADKHQPRRLKGKPIFLSLPLSRHSRNPHRADLTVTVTARPRSTVAPTPATGPGDHRRSCLGITSAQ